jgi:hypothetical protein
MKSKTLWALVGLNVLLLAGLFMSRVGGNAAIAQVRRPIDFLMIPGEVTGGNTGVVYIIDTSTGQLGAFQYSDSQKELNIMPPIDLARALEGTAGGGTRGGTGTRRRP